VCESGQHIPEDGRDDPSSVMGSTAHEGDEFMVALVHIRFYLVNWRRDLKMTQTRQKNEIYLFQYPPIERFQNSPK
jgi:hypothetical protein